MKKNFVRILALILVGLMVLSLIPLISYADWCAHEHLTTVVAEPVCGEDGYTAAQCLDCGETFGYEIIPHTEEHDFSACVESEDYLISEGSCTEPTLYFKSCSKCGHIAEFYYYQALEQMQQSLWDQYQREVAYHGGEVTDWNLKLQQATEEVQNRYIFKVGGEGHRFYEVEAQPATCTSDGWTAYQVCADCGEIEGYETVPAKGHRFGEFVVTKEPTCTETGVKERVCEVCGEKETETVPALGHKGPFTTIKAPTCTEAGSEKRICTVCGAEEVREIAPLGHKGPFTVTREATCTEDGVQERDCTVCGAHEVVAIPAAHKFGENGICTVCGAENPNAPEDREQNEQPVELGFADTDKFESSEQPVELGFEDTDVFEAGQITSVKIQKNGETVSEAKVGDTLTVVAEPSSLTYTYRWYRLVEGRDPVFFYQGTGESYSTYTLTTSDCTQTINCSVYAENDTVNAKSADNSVHVRLDVPFPVHVINGNDTANTVMTTNEDKPNFAPVIETKYPDAEHGTTNPFTIDALTENEVTLTATPGSGYAIRYVKEGTSEGSAVTRIPASAEAKTYTISSVSSGQRNNHFWVYFDTYEVNIDSERAILDTDIQTAKNPDIRKSFKDSFIKNEEPYVYYYVTPMWKGDPATPISDNDISALGGFDFSLDLPPEVTPENYRSFDIHLYHYVKSTDTWEEVDFKLVRVTEGGVVKLKANVSKFTKFSPFAIVAVPNVSLNLDPGEGSGEMEALTALSGEQVEVPRPTFIAPTGETFDCWKDGNGNKYAIGDMVTLTEDVTLTAEWKPGYTITFDDNDADSNNTNTYGAAATGEMAPMYVSEGETLALSKNAFSLKNHSFLGWSLTPGTNNTVDYADQEEVKPTSDMILYAVWAKTYYTISFEPNGGTGTMADQTAMLNSSVTLNKNAFAPALASKIFGGWSTSAGGNIEYADGATINDLQADMILYAVWRDKIAIHFYPDSDSGTGTGTMADQSVPSGVDTKLNSNRFTAPNGMTFKEWNTKKDGSGTSYGDGDNINVTGETYLYAQWRKDAAIITFEANGGNGTMEPQEMEKNVATALNPNTYTPQAGMAFNGWNTRADGSGSSFKDKATVRVTRDITLYAQWINACTITFMPNGGSGTMDDQIVETGVTTALDANSFTRINYEFEGWTTNPDGTGDRYADQGNVNTDKDITLYAKWKQIAYAITYDANGGGGTQMAQQNVPIGNTATIRDNAYNAKPGEVFAYWEDQNGTQYKPSDKIEPTADLALKAIWVDKLTISYYPGEGSGVYNEGEAPKDVPADIKTASEAKFTAPAGATFAYWQDDNGNRYYEGRQYAFSENTKLTAVWAPAITITFNKNASDAAGTMAAQTVGSGVETALNANRFSRSDYIFKYWTKTKSDPYPGQKPEDVSSSDVYKDGTNITVNQNTTLYAQWYKTAIAQNAVTITGELTGLDDFAVWGETLTAVVNDPVLKSGFNYNWLVDGNSVKEGTDNTYEVRKEDYGKTIICEVTHPQAANKVESNTKIVSTYAEDEDLIIINNGDPDYPYSKYAYVYGVVPGTTFTKDGRDYLVPDDADGYMEIAYPGVYTFGYATYTIENWYTVGYEVDNSGSGTVTMRNGSTTLTSNVPSSMRGDIQYYANNIWLVRQGSVTDLSITMRPASSTYVHWNINGGNYSSSATEVTRRLGNINQPILFTIVFNKSSSSPKTGDMSHLGMWSALCFTSLAGAAATIGASRKRRKSGK